MNDTLDKLQELDYFTQRQIMNEYRNSIGKVDTRLDHTPTAGEYKHNPDRILLIAVLVFSAVSAYFHFDCNIWYPIGIFAMPFVLGLFWVIQNRTMGLSTFHGMRD